MEAAIADGAKQIIILGGGYDPRAYLMAKQHPDVQFYELDRGVTRQTKLAALEALDGDLPNNLHSIECDLMKDNPTETFTHYTR